MTYLRNFNILGHIISADGVQPNTKKIKVILNLPKLTNILTLQSFFGLVAFVKKFIIDCSELIEPLTSLLKKNVPLK